MHSYAKRWIAGLLGAVLLFTSGCAATTEEPSDLTVQPLSQPQYPQMAPYPDESAFLNKVTGEFDDEGFREVYDAWRQDQQTQKNQPEGYADGLTPFFAASIPASSANSRFGSAISRLPTKATAGVFKSEISPLAQRHPVASSPRRCRTAPG